MGGAEEDRTPDLRSVKTVLSPELETLDDHSSQSGGHGKLFL